jgi:hypothetical protein
MSTISVVYHLPPLWLPESKALALELTADGRRIVCLIPSEELRRRYKTQPDLDGTAAQEVFDAFHEGIEQEIHSLLERHGLPPEGMSGPLVLNLAAPAGPWCLPARPLEVATA